MWDASGLYHAALADRLDVLAEHARGPGENPGQNVTTSLVERELHRRGVEVPSWIHVVEDTAEEQVALAGWLDLVGARDNHHRGEASVLTIAANRSWTAVVDDADARAVAHHHGVEVHGVLWVIAQQVVRGECTDASAESLVQALRQTGARFPEMPDGYGVWARGVGIL